MCLGYGAFSERGMRGNAVYRSEDAPVLTMYLLWFVQLLIIKFMFGMFGMSVWENPKQ